VLLLRAYRRTGLRVLLWSGLCFSVLVLNNTVLLFDKVVLPDDVDLQPERLSITLFALLLLLFGLIYEAE
jgi:hypothetical protein